MIYLDHAATSWPKPSEVIAAMTEFLERSGGNPGRSGHSLSISAGRIVHQARRELASYFGVADPKRLIFTLNATHAINLVLRGCLFPGDMVLTTGMEHNAVMRPLRALEDQGVNLRISPFLASGEIDISEFRRLLGLKPKLVVLIHGSNVTGQILPVEELTDEARRIGALVLIDAAQTAGIVPTDIRVPGADFIAFTGHKGLQGPPGIGGLVIGPEVDHLSIMPLTRGGTGSRSETEHQPDFLPDRFESGTPNGAGIAGLLAGLRWINSVGLESLRRRDTLIARRLIEQLEGIEGLHVYGPTGDCDRLPIVSISLSGKTVSEVGLRLDRDFGICARVGLHCAPAAHKTIGTFPQGTVRLSWGPRTSDDEIDAAVSAIREIATT